MTTLPTSEPLKESTVRVNGVDLHYVESGSGPLLLLLHGFPEFWYSWRHQIGPLSAAGFRVVVPDLRGYNLSSKPSKVSDYSIPTVAEDISLLIGALGERKAMLAGHDWGGMVAWFSAITRPDLYTRVAILNAPHPVPLARELKRWAQKRRFLYQLFFQIPKIPELCLSVFHFALLRRALRSLSANEIAFTSEDLKLFEQSWSQKGAIRSAIHYYRALPSARPAIRKAMRKIEMPVLLIWGDKDPVFVREVTENFGDWVPDLTVAHIPEASHFVMADAPQKVTSLLLEFFRR